MIGDRNYMNISFKNFLNYLYGIAIVITVAVMISSPSIRTSNTIDFQKPVEMTMLLLNMLTTQISARKIWHTLCHIQLIQVIFLL